MNEFTVAMDITDALEHLDTYKMLIIGRKKSDPNKDVAFIKHLVATYPNLVKKIFVRYPNAIKKTTLFQLPCMVKLFADKQNQLFDLKLYISWIFLLLF